MKKFYWSAGLAVFCLFFLSKNNRPALFKTFGFGFENIFENVFKSNFESDFENESENEEEELREKAAHREWLLRRYADPATGEIPYHRLADAQNLAENLRKSAADRSGFSGLTWQERGPSNVGGHLNDICFDRRDVTGNTAFLATNGGGLWLASQVFTAALSPEARPFFSKVGENILPVRISSVRQIPGQPSTIFVSSYAPGGIWRTTDGGQNWQKMKTTAAGIAYYTRVDLEISPAGTLFAADYNSLFRSTDGGTTWQTVFSGQILQDLEITATGKLYLLTGSSIYFSENDGQTWQPRATGFSGNNYFSCGRIAAAPSNPSKLYVILPNPSQNYGVFNFFKTENAGLNWQKIALPTTCTGVAWASAIAVDPKNDSRVFAGSLGWTVSGNGGSAWTKFATNLHSDQQCMAFAPGSSTNFLIGNDGGLARSTTANLTIPAAQHINFGLAVSENYTVAVHPAAGNPTFFTGMQDNGTHRATAPNLAVSEKWLTGGDGGFCHFDTDQPNIQIASSQNNLRWITNDNWLTYKSLSIGGGEFIAASDYDSGANILFTPQPNRGGFAVVKNVGTTNDLTKIDFPTSLGILFFNYLTAVKISPNQPGTVYFGNADGYIFKVKNAAAAVPEISVVRKILGSSRSVSSIEIEAGNENHLAVSYSNFGVVSVEETFDGGQTWQNIEGNLPDLPVNWLVFSPQNARQILLATDLGIWGTENAAGVATIWRPIGSGLNQNVQVQQLVFRKSDQNLSAATFGRGVFSTDFFGQNQTPNLLPDLAANSFSSPQNLQPGGLISMNFSAKNNGAAAATNPYFSIILSKNTSPAASDLVLVSGNLPTLQPSQQQTILVQANLPATQPPGSYFLILKLDAANQILESNENNNLIFNSLNIAAPPAAACESKSDFPWHEWIYEISIANLKHFSGKSLYGNHLDQTVNLAPGRSFDVKLAANFSYETFDEFWKIWIDFNQDGAFDPATETAFSGQIFKPVFGTISAPISGQIVVPATAKMGNSKMRVSMKRGSFPSPCETLPFGEVQDYSVNFSMSNAAVLPGSFVSPEARGTKPSPDVRFWPNPTAGKLFFQPKIEMAGEVFLEIFTVQGKPVFFQKYFSDGKTVIDLDVFGLENGVYFLRARGDGFRNFTEKMVVENGN